MSQLEVESALGRVVGYLRALLPAEAGLTNVRAIHSIGGGERVDILVESEWDTWEDLESHRQSSLAEDKVLTEFQPHVELGNLVVRVYEEIA